MVFFYKSAFSPFLVLTLISFMIFAQPEKARAQDADADGIPDSAEANLGGNSQHKDLFVECDYMQLDFNNDGDGSDPGEHSHRMDGEVVQELIRIFADAPVPNPGGVCRGGPNHGAECKSKDDCEGSFCSFTGITLHIEQDRALADQRFLDFTNRKGGLNFFDLKNQNFDFANRAPYYHYCILAHDASEEMGSASGEAEIFGNDFKVHLGAWPSETGLPVGTARDQIGTFLHELAHNLGLDHGGGSALPPPERTKNYKPNYLSVMNYFFQVLGINGQFDLSRAQLSTLNENSLNEAIGIGGNPTRYFCGQGALVRFDAGGGVNWNCVNPVNSPAVTENINADRTFLAVQVYDTLRGHNDWNNVHLNFTASQLYDAGVGTGFVQHQSYLGAYKPIGLTVGRGVDREPEITMPEGRCLEFFSVKRIGNGQTAQSFFRTLVRSQSDENRNGIGDVCER